ncbi:MAG: hypothetical protein QOE79_1966 [Sphingomonadales bacterium]|nr:hypothetical protein [Sphingomonadales bacterium]
MSADVASVQRWMHEALLSPRSAARADIDARLIHGGRLAAAAGLAIYQRGYFLRIAACMREQFPALCHALGQPLFDDFVADYVRDKPPESHTLYDLGRRFPAWLEENRPDRDFPSDERESWIDFMIDLARYERQVFAMFDREGQEGRPFAATATPDEHLRLQPCFDLGAYGFAVPSYYHAVRRGEAPSLPPRGPAYAALVRTDYVTRTIPLTQPQYVFLAAMKQSGTVERGAAALARHLGMDSSDVRDSWSSSGERQRWIDWGFFVAGLAARPDGNDGIRSLELQDHAPGRPRPTIKGVSP